MRAYRLNEGRRDKAVRLGCEEGLYKFLTDYANDMGMSRSSALRRLALIGAHCEFQHGKAPMPASYQNLVTIKEFREDDRDFVIGSDNDDKDDDFDWGED